MNKTVSKNHIDELLTRGVGEFIDPEGAFRKKLETNPESIVIKFGVDPTRPDLHLGHAVVLRKLRQFQDLGCKVIFLIGDYTTMIGDPTGKSRVRPEISQMEIEKNMQTYLDQVKKILIIDENVPLVGSVSFETTNNTHQAIYQLAQEIALIKNGLKGLGVIIPPVPPSYTQQITLK
jgi:tyrosyl-tRNA synthetase